MTIGKCIPVAALIAVSIPFAAWSQQSLPMTVHVRSSIGEAHPEATAGPAGLVVIDYPTTVYTVESGNLTYTLESDLRPQPEVGKDYEVKKVTRKEMILLIPRKNKGPAEVHFHIRSVLPIQQAK
ncbi:MAG: hypothetical protein ACLQOO_27875 [Terriglobia bacterium]